MKNDLFCSILSDALVENWAACFQMYGRNVSLCHLPMIIIVSGDTPARYIAISVAERRECASISMVPKRNHPLPRIWTMARNCFRIPSEVIVDLFPILSMEVLTLRFVCGSVPFYDWTHVTIFAHSMTGQKHW